MAKKKSQSIILFKSGQKCWPKSELLKNEQFISLKDFSELELTCDKYSTYTSRSKEHSAGGKLFGKQHKIVVGQILRSSLTKIIPIPRSLAFYQVTKYVTTWHALHDEYRVNLRDAKQRKKRINPMSRLLTAYKKKKNISDDFFHKAVWPTRRTHFLESTPTGIYFQKFAIG